MARDNVSHPRRTRGGGPKTYADLCENCEPMMKSPSTSKLSQETLKSDAASRERKENLENQLSDDRRVLLAITVEIEDGCVEHIQMKEGDSAEAVAMKFCQDHALPEQFVGPLTEHIVSNIISISKEDSDIVFHSQEEHMSYDENSPLRGGAPYSPVMHGSDVVDSVPKLREYAGQPHVTVEASAPMARREHRSSMDSPLMASQKVNRDQGCPTHPYRPSDHEIHKPRRKTRRKRGRKKVSDRLIAPTITSLAKTGALDYKEKPKSPRPKPLSEPAKAVYMRLYTEYIRHEHRSRDELKRSKALYQEKVVRKRMGLSKTSWRLTRMRGKIAKQYKNYGELLYAEGLTMRENHLKAVADKKQHDEVKELAELLPKPTISKRAKNIRREEGKVWSRLQGEARPKQDQLQELRQEVWESKLMECTFKPRINPIRKYEQDGVVDYSNRFEQLFMDAESRRRRRAAYMEWYPEGVTFQPCINKDLPYWAAMDDQDWHLERSVFRRLLENASRLMEKKEMQERHAHKPVDPRTGRELYKPLTGRKPHNRNPVHLPVGDYLYKMKFAFDSKIRSLNARDCKMKRELAECQYVGPTSQRLLKRLKERGLKQVFDFLDEDKDGFVDLTTANFDRLNDDVVEDLTRLMNVEGTEGECEGKEKKLNFEKFVKLMLAAERKYHRGQQLHLGLKHKIHGGESTFTFQSEMDQLSRNLATKRRKYSTHNQWFKIIIAELAKRQQKVEEWRKERREQEMSQCTFRPELSTYIRVKKAPDPGENCGRGESISETISNIIEKVQQEVHGFYFQDERGGPELLGMPAPASPTPSSRAMVTKGTSVSSSTAHSSGTRKVCSTSHSPARQDILSELDDLPKASNPLAKSGMFFGLMGA